MSKSKRNSKKAKSKSHGIKVVGGPKKEKPVSLLTAAAQVVKSAGKPMRVREIYDQVIEKKLWSSPAGKTPIATLSAGIQREISTKGNAARFRKADRGLFGGGATA